MNDYEAGQSWVRTQCIEPLGPGLDSYVQKEAEQLGQKWSITSRWTSFVAVDRQDASEHEVSLAKASRMDISELVRPRKRGSRFASLGFGSSRSSGFHGRGGYNTGGRFLKPSCS